MNIKMAIRKTIKLPKIEYYDCQCGQKIEIVVDQWGRHILGHFKPIRFRNKNPIYRTCPMSGELPPRKEKKHGTGHVPDAQDVRPAVGTSEAGEA